MPIQPGEPDLRGRFREVHVGDVDVLFRPEVHPRSSTGRDLNHANPHLGILGARLGVPDGFELRIERRLIDEVERLDDRLVEAPERNSLAIRTEPERVPEAELLLVDPVRSAVDDVLVAVGGELTFITRLHVSHEDVVFPHESDVAAIRGELREHLVTGLGADGGQRLRIEIPEVVLALGVLAPHPHRVREDEQLLSIGRELVTLDPDWALNAGRYEVSAAHQDLFLTGPGVDSEEIGGTALPAVGAREVLAVLHPADRYQVAGELPGTPDLLDGEFRHLRRRGDGNDQTGCEQQGALSHGRVPVLG